ncbi:heavy-metal-associated domain-containing protein [Noviherbaspirillum soli]|uniref:heavy-metal-associated domain-containing protein n=1 Tax=Noviherbaspirillum soli TaxID=1064518 RepID=UPI00188BE840|nr:cation transporter [Noviherbaspirillum soli]
MRSITKLIAVGLLPITSAFAATATTTALELQNMTCSLCSVTVKKALGNVPGVKDAKVDYVTKIATVTYDTDKTAIADLIKATTNAGFPSTPRK